MRFAIFSLLCCVFIVQIASAAECPSIPTFGKYQMNQRFLTIGSDFDILHNDQEVGKVIQRIFNFEKTFELLNEDGELVARAQKQLLAIGTKILVYDCQNRFLGSVQEDILGSLAKFRTVYSVLSSDDQLIGQSEKLKILATDMTFYGVDGKSIASLSRPAINFFTDEWVITVLRTDTVDMRILFFSAAYKTSADADRKNDSSP